MKAVVKQIPLRQRISRWNSVKFQMITWCFLRNIQITNADLDLLVLLSIVGKTKLTKFCELLVNTNSSAGVKIKKHKGETKAFEHIFNSLQSARNAVDKLYELQLIKREGKNKSNLSVLINPEIEIYPDNNVLINYQFLCIDPN